MPTTHTQTLTHKQRQKPPNMSHIKSKSKAKTNTYQQRLDHGFEEYINSRGEILTTAQCRRREAVHAIGAHVKIEYDKDGEEQIGYGVVTAVDTVPASKQHDPIVVIDWIYEKDDLLAEGISEARLAEMNFDDGDYARSDHSGEVCVYNVSPCKINIEFYFDGSLHRLEDVDEADNEDEEEEYAPPAAASSSSSSSTHDLPAHLAHLKEWLLSYKIWSDTKYGGDWWFLLQSLLSLGHGTSNQAARARLQSDCFEDTHREPKRIVVAWEPLSASDKQPGKFHCDACGMARPVSDTWTQTGWKVGKHCKQRIEALTRTCTYMQACRELAKKTPIKLTRAFLAMADQALNRLRAQAQEALAAN